MTTDRTDEQSFANSFDLQLFNLMESARNFACDGNADWKGVSEKLAAIRPVVRMKMHPKDQEITSA